MAQNYKKESIMKYKSVLSCIFNYAIQIELVSINYAASAYLKNVIGGEASKEINILNEQEFNNLMKVLENKHILQSIPVYLMAMLGLRNCEVCGLEWKDVDFNKRVISIKRDRLNIPKKGIVVNKTKTKYSVRDLYVCAALLDKLKQCKDYYDMLKKDDDEFDTSDTIYCKINGTPGNPHQINKLLERFLFEAKCPKISCHKLRHG